MRASLAAAAGTAEEEDVLYSDTVAAATVGWRRRYGPVRVAVNPGGTNERSVRAWFDTGIGGSGGAVADWSAGELVIVENNGDQFGAIATRRADVTVTDRTEAMYRTAPAHQPTLLEEEERGTRAPAAGGHDGSLCAGSDLIGPVSRKALLLPAAGETGVAAVSDGGAISPRAAATRDDSSWVRR